MPVELEPPELDPTGMLDRYRELDPNEDLHNALAMVSSATIWKKNSRVT